MVYDAVVIGAGIGGLISALKLSCSGKKVLLIEKQPQPGGLATNFSRKGFIFESSMHCVSALGPDGEIRTFLEKYGLDKKVEFIPLKDFCRSIYPEHDFVVDFNPDNFKRFLKNSFPQEKNNIEKLFREINNFYQQFDRFYALRLPQWLNLICSPLIYPRLVKISLCTVEQLFDRHIRDEKLKALIADIWRFAGLPPSRLSALYFLLIFRDYYYHSTCYIRGGFAQLFKAMVEKIKETGAEVKFNTSITKIVTEEEKKWRAVVTDRQEVFKAKVIISNANASSTLTELLDNAALKKKYSEKLSALEKSISAFQVYLGLKVPAKDLGLDHFMFSVNTTYNHDDSYNYNVSGNYDLCSFALVDHAQIDPTLVPQGKGSLLIMILDSYANWQNLKEEEYKKKKIEVANKLIGRAEKHLPGLSRYIEVMEVATPKTVSRFGSSPEGAIYGFAQTVAQSGMINRLAQKTDVKGLFLVGAWTQPGAGIHGSFVSSLNAAELALKFLK